MSKYDFVCIIAVLAVLYLVMAYRHLLPSVISIQELANTVNTKGGNILVLLTLTLIFFFTGMGLIYWSLNRMNEGKLSADNAVLMMALSWILGTAFGGAFSSMLKVMSGENPVPPANTSTTTATSTTTTVAAEKK